MHYIENHASMDLQQLPLTSRQHIKSLHHHWRLLFSSLTSWRWCKIKALCMPH